MHTSLCEEWKPLELLTFHSSPRRAHQKDNSKLGSPLPFDLVLILTFVLLCVCSWLGWLPGLPWHNGWSHSLAAAVASMVCKYEDVPLWGPHVPECLACLQLTLLDFSASPVWVCVQLQLQLICFVTKGISFLLFFTILQTTTVLRILHNDLVVLSLWCFIMAIVRWTLDT